MSIDVRPEDPRDFAAVRSLVARAFTDAVPLLERSAAQHAGTVTGPGLG